MHITGARITAEALAQTAGERRGGDVPDHAKGPMPEAKQKRPKRLDRKTNELKNKPASIRLDRGQG
ncbi:hypothetical protein LBMAG48_26320 [Phycisphaerae bacterium]|jgi:hypothetical protein|nr:hypothetical protein LBMAG48_26320 [Phycisphaerae bacterium]